MEQQAACEVTGTSSADLWSHLEYKPSVYIKLHTDHWRVIQAAIFNYMQNEYQIWDLWLTAVSSKR